MKNDLILLARQVVTGEPTGNFSIREMQDTLRIEMNKLVMGADGKVDYHLWQQNHNLVFQIIAEMIDTILPKRFQEIAGAFAEIKTFADGDKPRFTLKKGKANIKRFVTRVAAAGVYERVRMDRAYLDVDTYAHGGAVYQTLEAFLAGRENVTEFLEVLLEGIEDSGYADLTVMLKSILDNVPAANKHTANSFVELEFDRVLATVRAYGSPIIMCTQEFASTIIPTAGFIGEADRLDVRNLGYIGKYKGAPVVLIPQSFTDETNTVKTVDPQFAWIVPAGSMEKPIKWALEGSTKLRQVENADWSLEFQVYRKMGLALLNTNHIGIYKNTAL